MCEIKFSLNKAEKHCTNINSNSEQKYKAGCAIKARSIFCRSWALCSQKSPPLIIMANRNLLEACFFFDPKMHEKELFESRRLYEKGDKQLI